MLPINISLLCDFIENLCGSLVICKRLQQMSSLHNVTLPKSWLLLLVKHVEFHNTKDTRFYWIFVEPLLSLLGRIHTGSDAGLFFFFWQLSDMLMETCGQPTYSSKTVHYQKCSELHATSSYLGCTCHFIAREHEPSLTHRLVAGLCASVSRSVGLLLLLLADFSLC
jgi:hypothetical protein